MLFCHVFDDLEEAVFHDKIPSQTKFY